MRNEGLAKGNQPKNKPAPEWKRNEPPRVEGALFYMGAFHTLSTERPLGPAGPGRIPFSRLVWFGERLRLEPDVVDLFAAVINSMDGAFMEYQAEQRAQAIEDARNPPTPPAAAKGARSRRR